MTTRIPKSTLLSDEQIINTTQIDIEKTLTISELLTSNLAEIPNIEDTELFESVEEIVEPAPELKSYKSQLTPPISLTVSATVSADEKTTNITQTIDDNIIRVNFDIAPIINGSPIYSLQYHKNGTFEGSANLQYNSVTNTTTITGDLITSAMEVIDIKPEYGNLIIDNGANWTFTADGLISDIVSLPTNTPQRGDYLTTDGTGNLFWSIPEISYQTTTTLTNSSGIVNHDYNLGDIFIHNNILGNFEVNLTNFVLNNLKTVNIMVILNQDATERYITGFRINGLIRSIKWDNNDPPLGNPLKTDMYSFTILKAGITEIVLGQMMSFG